MEGTEDFDSFYGAAFARLVGQLAVVTGDRHEAEDVVQEAMARAASRWARLRSYDAPEAWVRRVAFNLAVSGHRRAGRRLAALLRLGPPAPVPPVSVDALVLAEALQELADGYASTTQAPGPAAARRRGRWRRRRTVGGLMLAGLLVIAASLGLLPGLPGRQTPKPIAPPPAPAPVPVPRSTAWFQATYLPDGLRLSSQSEQTVFRSGLPVRGAQSFRLVKSNGEFTVSVHPDLQRLEVARELRTYPTVRVVPVRGHQGLLFTLRPDNEDNGVIWEERPGLVLQVLGFQGVADRLLLDVAAGLQITETPAGTVAITVGPRPPWLDQGRGRNQGAGHRRVHDRAAPPSPAVLRPGA